MLTDLLEGVVEAFRVKLLGNRTTKLREALLILVSSLKSVKAKL
jgi:hypothetical protein